MRGAKENPELAEVRAILLKVQRLGTEPEEDLVPEEPAPAAELQAPTSRTVNIAVFDRKHKAIQAAEGGAQPKKRLGVYLAFAGALIAATAIVFATGIVNVPGEPPVLSQQDQESLLTEAHRLLSEGNVASARSRLLAGGAGRYADAAFVLAQSYDPNYLQSLAKADSAADVPEAARWYKKWYELAVQSGLEMDAGRLQRIINAMQRR
jgi:hypothetical protein